MTRDERMELLLRNVIAEVQESTVRKLPDTHRFRPIGLGLRIPDTQYVAYIIVECSEPNFHGRRLHIRVLKEGTDRAYEHIFPEMTSAEIRHYLTTPDAHTQIRQSIEDLYNQASAGSAG